uniref:Uncharacterized protein n=1 Tax=viral metagenome TaxID=1070528 RepID=A0A6M3LXL4_9ZZZZ
MKGNGDIINLKCLGTIVNIRLPRHGENKGNVFTIALTPELKRGQLGHLWLQHLQEDLGTAFEVEIMLRRISPGKEILEKEEVLI